MAPPGDGFAHNLLGTTIRVNISRIEKIDARVQADIDQLASPFDVGIAPRSKEFVTAAESAGSETQCRNFQARLTKLFVFYRSSEEWPVRLHFLASAAFTRTF